MLKLYDMIDVYGTDFDITTERERATCHDCGNRRMCKGYVWLGVPGLMIFVCKICELTFARQLMQEALNPEQYALLAAAVDLELGAI